MTGKTDYVSDGERVIALSNGHEILGKITGSGCIVGTAIATYCAASSMRESHDSFATSKLVGGDMLLGAVAGYVDQICSSCWTNAETKMSAFLS